MGAGQVNPEILVWAGLALVACVVVGAICYQSGVADGIEKARRIVDDSRVVSDLAGMAPAARIEAIHQMLDHDPPLISSEGVRMALDLPEPPVTRRQCRSCLLDVADCRCPMTSRRGQA
jgi:hypothetical protein